MIFLILSLCEIYIYIVLFGPVEPELGVIPSGQENYSGAEHLNFPGGELSPKLTGLCFFLKDIYIYILSLSSCRAASTDIPEPLSPLLPIIHHVYIYIYIYIYISFT